MKEEPACSRCGSEQVPPDGDVRRGAGIHRGIEVRVKNDPMRAVLTTSATAELHARVCVECGHVELSVSALASLRGALRERSKREGSP